jgi:hypothetical protein
MNSKEEENVSYLHKMREEFPSEYQTEDHIQDDHCNGSLNKADMEMRTTLESTQKEHMFKCDSCERQFVSKPRLKTHMKIHKKKIKEGTGNKSN